jgi:amidase
MTNYKVLSAKKKAQQESKIPQEWRIDKDNFHDDLNVMSVPETCGVLSDLDIRITTVEDATALAVEIKAGTWSVEQVTTAFCKRAAISHQLVRISHTDSS